MRLPELNVIVTGAGSGLGASAVRFLCAHGASVAAVDIDKKALEALRGEIDSPGRLFVHVADVASEQHVTETVRRALEDLGSLNCLINSAGIYRDGLLVHPDGRKMPLALWRKVIDVDLTGTFLITREVASTMIAHRISPGVFINLASISRHGNPGQSNYSAAKAGVVASTRAWARELAQYGIRVAAISPGLIRTPILAPDLLDPAVLDGYLEKIPLKRLGEPHEIDAAIRFIIECDYFTGESIEVNGGFQF